MKYLLAFILICCPLKEYHSQTPSYNWQIYNTGYNFAIIKIAFSDSLNGWALGEHNIIHTNDGGKTWEEQQIPVDTAAFREFYFVDSETGYAIGESGLILGTKDGGKIWKKQNSGAKDHLLRGISFINKDTGWVVGEMDDGIKRGGILLHTENGGSSWDTLSDRSDGTLYYDVKFYDNENGIVIGSYGFDNFTPIEVFSTNNSGVSLDKISEFTNAHTFYLYSTHLDTIWSVGFGFARSFDGGYTWDTEYNIQLRDSTLYGPPIFVDVLQFSSKTAWAVVAFMLSHTDLYYTNDYGLTWRIVNVPQGFRPTSVSFVGKYLIVGDGNGLIITNQPKVVGIVRSKVTETNFSLYQNYPNPFNPSTIIRYQLGSKVHVKITIFDLLGRKVRTLIDKIQEDGVHNVNWNGKDELNVRVNSGVYLYQLKYDNKSLVKKAILIH